MIKMVNVNHFAVLLAAIAAYVVGFLWYGPIFGKKWMALMGFTEKDKEKVKQKGMVKMYAGSFLTTLVMAYVLAIFIGFMGYYPTAGIQVGVVTWLGLIATTMLGKVFWESKPWALYVLDAGHYLVTLAIMGAILGAWRP